MRIVLTTGMGLCHSLHFSRSALVLQFGSGRFISRCTQRTEISMTGVTFVWSSEWTARDSDR